MAKNNRLRTLQRLAEHAEADNARRLAEQLRGLETEERRLSQVRGYLAHYAGSGAGGGPAGSTGSGSRNRVTTVGALRSDRRFVDRLQEAVSSQAGMVDTRRQQLEQQAARWTRARARASALDRFATRLDEREADRRQRREQGMLDEVGMRLRRMR